MNRSIMLNGRMDGFLQGSYRVLPDLFGEVGGGEVLKEKSVALVATNFDFLITAFYQ